MGEFKMGRCIWSWDLGSMVNSILWVCVWAGHEWRRSPEAWMCNVCSIACWWNDPKTQLCLLAWANQKRCHRYLRLKVVHLQCGVLLTIGASGVGWSAYILHKGQLWHLKDRRALVVCVGKYFIYAAGYRAVPNITQPSPVCFSQNYLAIKNWRTGASHSLFQMLFALLSEMQFGCRWGGLSCVKKANHHVVLRRCI